MEKKIELSKETMKALRTLTGFEDVQNTILVEKTIEKLIDDAIKQGNAELIKTLSAFSDVVKMNKEYHYISEIKNLALRETENRLKEK